ncbi:BlaR1 family beta-lactam sensor/signal transducer [Alkalihalobacillus oceani]|uniref:BlaR1 family beta-lactam sensor/signal transducer n=1 Tax=Halalkalibacter oceani TaxID=1653776 RepID=UPI00204002CE|nr:BlaR1 family beta-lactam sensor/signal transducer [Halalkalibacter oceani]MCM3761633.1 BlaR1 family beta-lactam sensor/signal transducer [Halalkalibacter oceani]
MEHSFFTLFLISNLLISLLLVVVICLKKAVKHHVTVNTLYRISVVSFLLLLAPFFPVHLLNFNSFAEWLSRYRSLSPNLAGDQTAATQTGTEGQNGTWLQDFSVAVEQSSISHVDSVLLLIWVAGMAVMLLLTLHSNRRIFSIKKSLQVVDDQQLSNLLDDCQHKIGFSRKVVLGHSALITSPLTFGVVRPYIVLPKDISHLTKDDLRYILLHELYHSKRKDMLVNYLLGLFRTIYWFNPFVSYFLKEMKTEMEVSCDYAVLKQVDEEEHLHYAEVILKFATLSQRTSPLVVASEISSSYKEVKRRIVTIVDFKRESPQLKLKSSFVFTAMLALVLLSTPTLSAFAVNADHYHFSGEQAVYKDYSHFFDTVSGGAVLFDPASGQYTVYNREVSTRRYAPASTYKVFNALLALEAGVITRADSKMAWDGTTYQYEEWNRDHDLFTAMASSASWYFQQLDQQLGRTDLQRYYEQLDYGNAELSGSLENYWADASLMVSPVEQIEMLRKLYENQLGFAQENIETVKDAILLEQSDGARLYGKTGTLTFNGEDRSGWFVGFVETNEGPHYFAVHIEGERQAGGRVASEIALSILEQEGIYQSVER